MDQSFGSTRRILPLQEAQAPGDPRRVPDDLMSLPKQTFGFSNGEALSREAPEGIIFDLDFSLIHSWWWPTVITNYASQFGVEISFVDFLISKTTERSLFGWVSDHLARHQIDVPEGEIERECQKGREALLKFQPWWAEELAVKRSTLLELRKSGYRLGVVTNRPTDSMNDCLQRHKLSDIIEVGISREMVKIPKPDPEGILKVVDQFQLAPAQAAYLGDTVVDMKVALAAGVLPVGLVNNTFIPEINTASLWAAGAREVMHLHYVIACLLNVRRRR